MELVEDRLKVQTVSCPECLVQPGESCLGVFRHRGRWAGQRKPRFTNHRERVSAYNHELVCEVQCRCECGMV